MAADLELGNDSLLTTSLATNDRITITRAANSQQVATMTVAEFMNKCAAMMPVATESANGVMDKNLFKGFFYREFNLIAQTTQVIGRVTGLMSIQIPYRSARTGLYIINPYYKEVLLVAGNNFISETITFSFNSENYLQISNSSPNNMSIYLFYQSLGILK